MPSIEQTIDAVLETVKKAKDRQKKCCLLIGAGCSVKAGVPLASGFVDIIKRDWPAAFGQANEPKHYPQCMAALSLSERRDLIGEHVDKAKLNWGHIAIAQLMKHGYVDRVLTTNFDPLVVRACAMVGHFPAVYDFAVSQVLKPADISGDAVFYLHGQRNGFVLMNTVEECGEHSKKLAPLFQDAGQGRVWIVVGYSGENDPVFDHLARVESFDNKLYWIGYKDNEPAEHVRTRLLQDGKYAFHVKGFDADDFFVTLTQKLGCFPPRLVSEPFSHLNDLFKEFTDYKAPQQEQARDITEQARQMVRDAIGKYEKPAKPRKSRHPAKTLAKLPSLELQVMKEFMAGNYDKLIQIFPADQPVPAEFVDAVAWSYIAQADALSEPAKQKSGAEADRLFAQAGEKYEAALRIKPDKHEALNNWGNALLDQAKQKSGAEADRLFAQAGEKYEAALRIKPDDHEAHFNWGNALSEQAKQKSDAEADRLFAQATEKYEAALRIKPDKHKALYNWGNALLAQAQQKSGAEADRLFAQACEKYEAALRIKPDKHEALNNWGTALMAQAKQKSGAEADRLLAQAGEKYEAALRIKPDTHEALNNWGTALLDQAKQKSGAEADRLFGQAAEKYLRAEELMPGQGAYGLACISALQGREQDCRAWLEKSQAQGQLPSQQHLLDDTDLMSVRSRDWFQSLIANL